MKEGGEDEPRTFKLPEQQAERYYEPNIFRRLKVWLIVFVGLPQIKGHEFEFIEFGFEFLLIESTPY